MILINKSKKGFLDYYLIIFVAITMAFFLIVMNVIISNLPREVEVQNHINKVNTHIVANFLEVSANSIISQVPDITIAEYIGTIITGKESINFDDEFKSYFNDFRLNICDSVRYPATRCSIEIIKNDCRPESNCVYRSGSSHNPAVEIKFTNIYGEKYSLVLSLKEVTHLAEQVHRS